MAKSKKQHSVSKKSKQHSKKSKHHLQKKKKSTKKLGFFSWLKRRKRRKEIEALRAKLSSSQPQTPLGPQRRRRLVSRKRNNQRNRSFSQNNLTRKLRNFETKGKQSTYDIVNVVNRFGRTKKFRIHIG